MRTPEPSQLTPGHRAPAADRSAVEHLAGPGAAAYGELCADALGSTLRWLRLTAEDEFVDLGSGVGKLVTQAALQSEVGLARGVELSRFRHRLAHERWARELRGVSSAEAKLLRARVRLEWGDLREVDLGQTTVAYMCSTCFPEPLLDAVAGLACAAPRLRLLLSTRALGPRWSTRLPEQARLRVRTTWDPHAWLYAYAPVAGSAG